MKACWTDRDMGTWKDSILNEALSYVRSRYPHLAPMLDILATSETSDNHWVKVFYEITGKALPHVANCQTKVTSLCTANFEEPNE